MKKKESKNKLVGVKVTETTKRRLEAIAVKKKRSISYIANEIITEKLGIVTN
jgi:predicted transcriptional regulator